MKPAAIVMRSQMDLRRALRLLGEIKVEPDGGSEADMDLAEAQKIVRRALDRLERLSRKEGQ